MSDVASRSAGAAQPRSRRFCRPSLGWLLALLSTTCLPACRWFGADERPRSWVGDGGELGRRVREGKLAGVAHHRFHSSVLHHDVGVVVVTPPSYAERPEQRYPVVYAFPGIGGDEWAYLAEVGLQSSNLATLFADPATAPLLVFANHGDSGAFGSAERVLGEELVAFVDRTYRTRAEASARSLEGFSLGGVTALTLLMRRPEVFGRAVAASSACYLLSTCGQLRESLRSHAAQGKGRVLLTVGARENRDNRTITEELAPLLGVEVVEVPGADHNLAAQLKTRVGDRELGSRFAEFHLAGFAHQ